MRLALIASALLLAACNPARTVEVLRPDPSRLDCRAIEERPVIPAERMIEWQTIQTIQQARQAHEAYVASVRERELIVAGYIQEVEATLWHCASDAIWLSEYYGGIEG